MALGMQYLGHDAKSDDLNNNLSKIYLLYFQHPFLPPYNLHCLQEKGMCLIASAMVGFKYISLGLTIIDTYQSSIDNFNPPSFVPS